MHFQQALGILDWIKYFQRVPSNLNRDNLFYNFGELRSVIIVVVA